MSLISRKKAPASEDLINFKILEGKHTLLKNNIPLYYVNAGTEDVIKLDLVFEAGIRSQKNNATAVATSSMLSEGTSNKTSAQLANELDFFGSYLQTRCSADDATVTLFCLK